MHAPFEQSIVPQQSPELMQGSADPELRQQVSSPLDSSVSQSASPQHMNASVQLVPTAEPPVHMLPVVVVPQVCVDVLQL